jgi:short-subunit dehydrogenase
MPKPLGEQVVVITGASSGIGRATALEFARAKTKLVLASRNEAALNSIAAECEHVGSQTLVVPTDVSRRDDVERLADRAIERFERIDTWVNNAGVTEYGYVEDTPVEDIERIMQVNFMSQVYAIKAALPYLTAQPEATIINVSSGLGERAVPLQAAYCASKHAVKGFTEALRMELQYKHPGVRVTLVLPSSINTPLFAQSRSRLGVKPRPVPVVYEPELVAKGIVTAAQKPVRDIVIGEAGKMLLWVQKFAPGVLDWLMVQNGTVFKLQQTDQPPEFGDNLYAPVAREGKVHGEWGKETAPVSPFTTAFEFHPFRKRAVGLGLLLATGRKLFK